MQHNAVNRFNKKKHSFKYHWNYQWKQRCPQPKRAKDHLEQLTTRNELFQPKKRPSNGP